MMSLAASGLGVNTHLDALIEPTNERPEVPQPEIDGQKFV